MRCAKFFLATIITAGSALAAMPAGLAQPYPAHAVKIIVPTPRRRPGRRDGAPRRQWLSHLVGRAWSSTTGPGAGNTIGSQEAAQAEPDGYTLHYSSVSGLVLAPMLQKTPVTTDQELRADRAGCAELDHPGGASLGPGQDGEGTGRLRQGQSRQGQLLLRRHRRAAASDRRNVQVGAPASTSYMCPTRAAARRSTTWSPATVQMTFEGTGVLLPLIQAGRLRALALTSAAQPGIA